jgi:hypothetical protein
LFKKIIFKIFIMAKKNWIIILIIIGLLILISFGVIFGLSLKPKPQPSQTPTISQPTQAPQQKQEPIDTSNWKTYRNEKYRFEVKYPKDWEIFLSGDESEVSFYNPNLPLLYATNTNSYNRPGYITVGHRSFASNDLIGLRLYLEQKIKQGKALKIKVGNNHEGIMQKTSGVTSVDVFVGSKYYFINQWRLDKATNDEEKQELEQIFWVFFKVFERNRTNFFS